MKRHDTAPRRTARPRYSSTPLRAPQNLQTYWVGIMQIFNLVCPRPRILPSRPKSPTKTSRAANYDAFRAAEAAAAAAHTHPQGASERSVDVPETADPLGGAKKPKGFFSRLFQRAPAAAAARVRTVPLHSGEADD